MNDPNLHNTIVLWGDSHAHAWARAIARVARAHHTRVVEFARAGCPPVLGVHRTIDGGQGAACNTTAINEAIVQEIERIAPSKIILAARWSLYTRGLWSNDVMVENTFVTDGAGTANAESSRVALTHALPATIARLSRIAPVIVVKTLPVLHQPMEQGYSRNRDGFTPTLEEHRHWESVTDPIFAATARATPNVTFVDPADYVCERRCRALIGAVPLYTDDNHPTERGAMFFAPQFSRALFPSMDGNATN